MIANSPQAVADKPQLVFVSLQNYRTLINALLDKQTYNPAFFVIDNGGNPIDWAFKWPYATNFTVVTVGGLQGRKDIFMGQPEDFVIGRDGEHDEEYFKVWFEPLYLSIFGRTMARWGTAFPHPQYIVWEPGGYN